MKSRFKEVCINAEKIAVDLDDILKVAAGEVKIAYILHDKNACLPHYHIFLDFGNNRVEGKVVIDLLKVPKESVCTCRGKDWADLKRYMLHSRDYEYSVNEIVSNFDIAIL